MHNFSSNNNKEKFIFYKEKEKEVWKGTSYHTGRGYGRLHGNLHPVLNKSITYLVPKFLPRFGHQLKCTLTNWMLQTTFHVCFSFSFVFLFLVFPLFGTINKVKRIPRSFCFGNPPKQSMDGRMHSERKWDHFGPLQLVVTILLQCCPGIVQQLWNLRL